MKTVSRSTFAVLLAAIDLYAGQAIAGMQTFTLAAFEVAQKQGRDLAGGHLPRLANEAHNVDLTRRAVQPRRCRRL